MDIQSSQATEFHQSAMMALPPWAQEKREKDAIIAHERVLELLIDANTSILDIQRYPEAEKRTYTVTLGDETFLEVVISYLPLKNNMVGPARFALNFLESVDARIEAVKKKTLFPLTQEQLEKKAILSDERLGNKQVVRISATSAYKGFDKGYTLTLDDNTLTMVGLTYLVNDTIGPKSFALTFQD